MKNKINKEKIEEFYNRLCESTTSKRKKKNLEIIYNILIQQYEISSNNFSIAHIGRLSQKEGGPITQTIRNKQGQDYQKLINFFADNIQIVNASNINQEYNLSDYIEDPALKAHINILIAENKSLKSQLNILKQNMSKNYELNYIHNDTKSSSVDSILLKTEIDSIKKFLDDLEKLKLPIFLTDNGTIRSEDDELIANVGFVDALKKLT